MKLSELKPEWAIPEKMMTFDCPHCQKIRLSVTFEPTPMGKQFDAVDEKYGVDHLWVPCNPQSKWQREGKGFEDMTVKPSLNAEPSGHWHGFITNGEIITV